MDQVAELSFILFFSDTLLRTFFCGVFGTNLITTWIGILIPYIPLFFLCIRNPYKYIKLDFIVLWVAVIAFFAVTLFFHPEYAADYTRDYYGVWDHVLKPHRGIYAFLFIRLIAEPKRIMKCMRIAGYMMMVYFVYKVIKGDWTTVGESGVNTEASYSVAFGYDVLTFALVFMYSALREKKLVYYIAAIADIVMILVAGSRGPVLFLGLFIALYYVMYTKRSRKKGVIILLTIAGVCFVFMFYNQILDLAMSVLRRFNVSSRFIRMLKSGKISNDNNRFEIWGAALDMIKANPFGYGAMGSRHVIKDYIYAGYPHSIIFEFLIDYGVFVGGFFLLSMFGYSFCILFTNRKMEWRGVYLVFFCSACSLFISLTYWSISAFWVCLALGVCSVRDKGRLDVKSLLALIRQ